MNPRGPLRERKQVKEQPRDHGRQAHTGIEQADHQTPQGHPAQGQEGPHGQA